MRKRIKLRSSGEQPVLLTSEPSLQLHPLHLSLSHSCSLNRKGQDIAAHTSNPCTSGSLSSRPASATWWVRYCLKNKPTKWKNWLWSPMLLTFRCCHSHSGSLQRGETHSFLLFWGVSKFLKPSVIGKGFEHISLQMKSVNGWLSSFSHQRNVNQSYN